MDEQHESIKNKLKKLLANIKKPNRSRNDSTTICRDCEPL